MDYTISRISGLGKTERERLSAVVRGTQGTISVGEVAEILSVTRRRAAKMLSLWASKGWVARVKRGIYVRVPLEARTASVGLEDPWIVAEKLYSPCYIGGWSAVEYWEMTEQIFRTVVVMTTRKPPDRNPVLRGTAFLLRTIQEKNIFGLKSIWRERVKVSVSDPTRTVIDLLDNISLGGGLRPTVDAVRTYLSSENRDDDLMFSYARRVGNGAILKRLGFLLEDLAPGARGLIAKCKASLTKGNAKLDPSLKESALVTRWRLWIPAGWKTEVSRD